MVKFDLATCHNDCKWLSGKRGHGHADTDNADTDNADTDTRTRTTRTRTRTTRTRTRGHGQHGHGQRGHGQRGHGQRGHGQRGHGHGHGHSFSPFHCKVVKRKMIIFTVNVDFAIRLCLNNSLQIATYVNYSFSITGSFIFN